SEIKFFQQGNAAQKFRLHQKALIRLALHDVTNADELGSSHKTAQLRPQFRRAQIHPADDSDDKRELVRQIQKPPSLLQGLARLHGNAALEGAALQLRLQISGQKITPQWKHRVVNPLILPRVVPPEVLVRVDVHRGAESGHLSANRWQLPCATELSRAEP